MDLHSLIYFQKAAQLQHISRAAEALHVAQPSLSRSITALERELGVPLFDRFGKGVTLNSYGQIVLRHTNAILQSIENIHKELEDTVNQSQSSVSISLYAASKLFPSVLMKFKKLYPSISLRIVQENLRSAEPNNCDISIFSSMYPCSADHEITLIEEEILLALPDDNPLASKSSIHLQEVSGEEFICLQPGKSLRTITDTYCQMAGFSPTVILESDSPETVREMIRAGIGISFVPSVTWSGIETSSIALVPISFPQCRRYINLSWKSSYLSPAAILFRDFLIHYFSELSAPLVESKTL